MPQPISFTASEREQRILHYLFRTKVATFGQIHKKLFPNRVKSTPSKKLQRLLKGKFIEKGITDFKGKQTQVFYLNPKTVDLLFSEDGDQVERYQAQSGSAEHDLILGELDSRLSVFKPVKKFWTENELQCLKECSKDPRLLPFVLLRSDAVLEISSNGEQMVTPLELEISQKANSRYEEKISKYYERESTICVLFISGSAEIQKAVMAVEREVAGASSTKFYYALIDDVLKTNEAIEFRNFRGDKFVLH